MRYICIQIRISGPQGINSLMGLSTLVNHLYTSKLIKSKQFIFTKTKFRVLTRLNVVISCVCAYIVVYVVSHLVVIVLCNSQVKSLYQQIHAQEAKQQTLCIYYMRMSQICCSFGEMIHKSILCSCFVCCSSHERARECKTKSQTQFDP